MRPTPLLLFFFLAPLAGAPVGAQSLPGASRIARPPLPPGTVAVVTSEGFFVPDTKSQTPHLFVPDSAVETGPTPVTEAMDAGEVGAPSGVVPPGTYGAIGTYTILLSDNGAASSTDVAPRLEGLGHTVVVSDAATWNGSFDYSPYDVVAFEFSSQNPADIGHLVDAVDAGTVGVVFFRGFYAEPTALALGLITTSAINDLDWVTPTDLGIVDNSHPITSGQPIGVQNLGYTYMSEVHSPDGGNTTTLANGPKGSPALLVHNTRRAVVTPFYGHFAGYDSENATGLRITQLTLCWASGDPQCGGVPGVPAASAWVIGLTALLLLAGVIWATCRIRATESSA